FQVRRVAIQAVVLGAGGELDVFAHEVQDAAALVGSIVAAGRRMAVEVRADPAGGGESAGGPGREPGPRPAPYPQRHLEHVERRTMTDGGFVRTGLDGDRETAVGTVEQIDNGIAGAGRAPVGVVGPVDSLECNLAWDRSALFIADLRDHKWR